MRADRQVRGPCFALATERGDLDTGVLDDASVPQDQARVRHLGERALARIVQPWLLVDGLLGADMLGFHTNGDASRFLESAQSTLDVAVMYISETSVRTEILKVGRAFNPEVGFLRRTDFTRSPCPGMMNVRPT